MKPSALCLLFLAFGCCLNASDHCSLSVKVIDPDGNQVATRVVVEEHDGRRTGLETKRGGVQFCDLGITPVTITVGNPECNQVIVRNISLKWEAMSQISVIYDRRSCLVDAPPVAACQFLLRFVDSQRRPVAVSLRIQEPNTGEQRSDDFGRIYLRIAARQEMVAEAQANGFDPARVSIPCISQNQQIERYVTLEKRRR